MWDLAINGLRLTTSMCRPRNWHDLASLISACFPEMTKAQVSYDVRTKAWSSCIFWNKKTPIAYWMHNNRKGPKVAWGEQIGIHPDYRGKKLGGALYNHYVQFEAWMGFDEIHVSVLKINGISIKLCESFGFERRDDKTNDRWLFVKALDPSLASGFIAPRGLIYQGKLDSKMRDRFIYPRSFGRVEDYARRVGYSLLKMLSR